MTSANPSTRPGKRSALVVGAGVGGLAAAVRLAARGVDVTLVEKNSRVGGKLNQWMIPHPQRRNERPFRFDTGPSLLTLPLVMADLFSAAGDDVRHYLQISRLNPISQFIWADGSKFTLPDRLGALPEAVRQFAAGEVAGAARLVRHGRKVWDLSADTFLFHAPEQIFKPPGGRSPLAAFKMISVPLRIGALRKYGAMVDRCIRDRRLRDIFYQYATYSGSSPHSSPATTAVIPFVEMEMGGWHVQGGMYRIAEALEALARKVGVTILTDAEVVQVNVEQQGRERRATGVTLRDGRELIANAVVVNADVVWAYRNLIAPEHRPSFDDEKLDQLEPGGSGLVLMLGVEGRYPQLTHHTKFMPDDYSQELRAMFGDVAIPDDPCIYVCAPTRTDESLAPPGCENLFVLCSAPALYRNGAKIDWSVEGPRYRDRIVHKLQHTFGLTDLAERIVVERMMTPADLASRYNANAGSIYGVSGNGVRQAFLRPPNRDKDVKGLFFAGGATHPGGGLPLVALSGKIVSELVLQEFGRD